MSQKVFKIRLGLLVDSLYVPNWIDNLLNYLQNDPRFEIVLVIENGSFTKSGRSSVIYRLLRKVDNYLMKLPSSPFSRKKLYIPNASHTIAFPQKKKYSDYFSPEIIQVVKDNHIDFLLRFGFRIIRGEMLKAAQYGILSLHHGDTSEYRGGPPAFWEVVNRAPVTAVTLQLLTEKLDAGTILDKCYLKTDITSFHRNQHKLYWAGEQLFRDVLKKMADRGILDYLESIKQNDFGEQNGFLYKNPGNFRSFQLLIKFGFDTFRRASFQKFRFDQWCLLYSLQNGKKINDYELIKPPRDRIYADPFVVSEGGLFYLFFEEKLKKNTKAHISLLRFDESGNKIDETPHTVLREDFHLSYPFVFRLNGKFYMVPESSAANEVILYESIDFPFKWERKKTLIDNRKCYDSTLFQHSDGVWYLFCTSTDGSQYSSNAYLHIFYSSDVLNEEFKAHPQNPIYKDVRRSRPAGKIFFKDGNLIRPSQVCAPNYGNAVRLNIIKELSINSFKEDFMELVTPDSNSKMKALHTYNREDVFHVLDCQKNVLSI